MSDTFAASNGIDVAWRKRKDGAVVLQINAARCTTAIASSGDWVILGEHERDSSGPGFTEGSATADAMREFFLHERDSDLGRWRWPENPQYVVYPSELYLTPPNADLVTVVNERNGQSSRCRQEDDGSLGHFSLAARAYFAAHPEPRPWHDAKPGEVWAITTENVADEVAVQRTDTGDWQYCDGLTYRDHELKIETARRIWPEVSP